jgi:hypothetical protein
MPRAKGRWVMRVVTTAAATTSAAYGGLVGQGRRLDQLSSSPACNAVRASSRA